MHFKIFSLLVAVTVIVLLGCAGTGGWNTIKTPDDPNFLFANGTAESADLQLAIDRATLSARTEVGRQLELKLNSMQKSFAEETGAAGDELLQMYTTATKAVVSTQLSGSKIRESKYQEKNGIYRAVVLVEYPIGAGNAALLEQIKNNQNLYTRFRASESFKELENEVEKYENWKKEKGMM